MISGFFVGNIPWIELVVTWQNSAYNITAILDTGFSGDLQITPRIVQELSLPSFGTIEARIANGAIVTVPVVLAATTLEGVHKQIQVLVSNSTPLVGIDLLSKFSYKAVVDCKNKTVALQKVQS